MRKLHSCLLSAVSPSHILRLHIYFSSTTREIVAGKSLFFPLYKDCQQHYLKGAECHSAYSITSTNIYDDKPQGTGLKG